MESHISAEMTWGVYRCRARRQDPIHRFQPQIANNIENLSNSVNELWRIASKQHAQPPLF